jgi:hypothetical protein
MSKAPKIVDFKFIDENAPQDIIDNELDEIVNDQDNDSEPEELIRVEEKPEIDVDEIFELQSQEPEDEPEAHPVFEPPLETPKPKSEPQPKRTKPVKLNKDGTERKKRAPLTEAEKAKRRESLKKAQAVRKQKTIERAEARDLAKKEKELLKKKKIKDVEKLEREVNDEEAEPPPQNRLKGDPGLTKEDLVKAQYDAIMAYENLRKERKAEKKKKQLVEQEQQKMMNKIHQATVGYRYRDGSNRFDGCY